MRTKKKLLAVVLTLAMALSLLPVTALADPAPIAKPTVTAVQSTETDGTTKKNEIKVTVTLTKPDDTAKCSDIIGSISVAMKPELTGASISSITPGEGWSYEAVVTMPDTKVETAVNYTFAATIALKEDVDTTVYTLPTENATSEDSQAVSYTYTPASTNPPAANKCTITLNAGGGTGTMTAEPVDAGTSYTLPVCTFTAPTGKKFNGWQIGSETKAAGDKITISENTIITATWVEDSGSTGPDTPVTPPATTMPVTFGKITSMTDFGAGFGNQSIAALGDFAFATSADGKTITVTGTANYVTWQAFNGADKNEQQGHYLPINIAVSKVDNAFKDLTVSGKKDKTFEASSFDRDNTIQLAMFLDTLENGQFTATYNNETYKVDCTGVVLTPKSVTGTTTTVDTTTGTVTATDTTTGSSVEVPKDVLTVGSDETPSKVAVVVDQVDNTTAAGAVTGQNSTVVSSIQAPSTSVIEVTIKTLDATTGEPATEVEVSGLSNANALTINIKVGKANTAYYVLCLDNGVTSFGRVTSDSSSNVSFKTTHLSTFAAVEETSANRNALAAIQTDPGAVTPTNPTRPVYPSGGGSSSSSGGGSSSSGGGGGKSYASSKTPVAKYPGAEQAAPITNNNLDDPNGGSSSTGTFTDVPATHWAAEQIKWASEKGVMNGTGAGQFSPTGIVTRQQLWMVLGRIAGENPANMAAARDWASANGISDGSGAANTMSRQQLVTMLYRYAQAKELSVEGAADLSTYPDNAGVANYAKEAMAWAVENGIITGTSDGKLNPEGSASRAQFAVILYRFADLTKAV